MTRTDPRSLGALCDSCPLRSKTPVVPDQVVSPTPKKLVILAETPAETEQEQNQFLVGATGQVLDDRILAPTKVPRDEAHISNALLCWPGKETRLSPKEWTTAVKCCRPRLSRELAVVAPKVILAFGKRAAQATLGKAVSIGSIMGSFNKGAIFKDGGKKKGVVVADFSHTDVTVTWHPSMLFREKWHYLPFLRAHVSRAWAFANGNLEPWDWGERHIHRGPELLAALKVLASRESLAIDIETTSLNGWEGKVKCIGFSDGYLSVVVPWHTVREEQGCLWSVDPVDIETIAVAKSILRGEAIRKIFQNGVFDRTFLRFHAIRVARPYWDTLHAHMLLAPGAPHALDFQGATETHAPNWKQAVRGGQKGGEK